MVDGVSSGTSVASSSYTGSNTVMGKDDFLNLMITQMKYQDPLNPMDSTQYGAQLAEFSSLEQLQNINENLNTSIDANYLLAQSINNTMSATLIGNDVKLNGNSVNYSGQEKVEFGYNLPKDVESLTVKVYNSAGKVVKEFTDLEKTTGEYKLSWDFTDSKGKKVPTGDYKVEVEAKDYKKNDISVDFFKFGSIEGIKFSDSGSTILVNGKEYRLSDILEILTPTKVSADDSKITKQ